ncbi:MAG: hypothetical protein ACJ0RQ_16350 [Candidatus Azotimanducaceae bacterium]
MVNRGRAAEHPPEDCLDVYKLVAEGLLMAVLAPLLLRKASFARVFVQRLCLTSPSWILQ